MSANIFILCWILGGLLNVPIMILLRKKFNRKRTQSIIEEIGTCLKYGPLLLIGIFLESIRITEEEKQAKRLKKEKQTKLLRIEELRIKDRFEILDL